MYETYHTDQNCFARHRHSWHSVPAKQNADLSCYIELCPQQTTTASNTDVLVHQRIQALSQALKRQQPAAQKEIIVIMSANCMARQNTAQSHKYEFLAAPKTIQPTFSSLQTILDRQSYMIELLATGNSVCLLSLPAMAEPK